MHSTSAPSTPQKHTQTHLKAHEVSESHFLVTSEPMVSMRKLIDPHPDSLSSHRTTVIPPQHTYTHTSTGQTIDETQPICAYQSVEVCERHKKATIYVYVLIYKRNCKEKVRGRGRVTTSDMLCLFVCFNKKREEEEKYKKSKYELYTQKNTIFPRIILCKKQNKRVEYK